MKVRKFAELVFRLYPKPIQYFILALLRLYAQIIWLLVMPIGRFADWFQENYRALDKAMQNVIEE